MSTDPAFSEGDVCMPNIGPKQRAMRRRFGVAMGLVAAAAGAAMIALHAPRVTRLALFLPLAGAALGVFQARAKT